MWLLIVFLIVAIIVALVLLHDRQEEKRLATIKKVSKKIEALIALNESTHFYKVHASFEINKFYDNKTNFNRIDPAFLMAADIRENMEACAKCLAQVKENREKFVDYQKKVNELFHKEFPIDFDSLEMPLSSYYKYEEKLFNQIELKPVIDCLYHVRMSYSSPQGRVHLRKEDVFNFDDVFACYESVSRSHLDRNTYKKLSAVERGEVSDSLRYDILNRNNFTCVLCGASARQGARLHVDHIVPIAKGGKSVPSNLRTLCERCNIGKSDKIEKDTSSTSSNETLSFCKWCGGKMVLRKGKYGEFYGCSNYPKCEYTETR